MTFESWRLFLDDEREPTWDLGADVLIARDCAEAILLVEQFGLPELISFDHDLGSSPEGVKPPAMKFLHWLIDGHLDGRFDLQQLKRIIVHSRNPEGAKNIAGLWNSFASSIGSPVRAVLLPRSGLYK